jgi:hypothetical protein
LAHSAQAANQRQKFMEMRRSDAAIVSDREQIKYFLLHSRFGITMVFAFAALAFFSGIGG